ncbi:hypothetical protein [Micromonospora echinospora]|uniref:hypothetical protein n=1 Tax=Micromonospora echinospora TaxID=1877 RepID=UPI003CF347AC
MLDVDAQIAGLRDPVHPERAGVDSVVAEAVSAAADAHALRAVRLGEVMVNNVRPSAAEVVADDGVTPHVALLPHSPGNGSRRNERETFSLLPMLLPDGIPAYGESHQWFLR